MITFNSESLQFQLDTSVSSYVMQVRNGFLLHIYWGEKLNKGDHSYMRWQQGKAAFSPYMENCAGLALDDTPLEYPCFGRADLRSPALEIINSDGSDIVDLRYSSYEILQSKPKLNGLPAFYTEDSDNSETLIITLKDDISNVECKLFYTVFYDTDIITRHAEIKNCGEKKIVLKNAASAAVDFDNMDFDVVANWGTHAKERMVERYPLIHGKLEFASRRGASGHANNPYLILASKDASEDYGTVYGTVLVYSGNHAMTVEGTQYNAARAVMGINPEGFGWNLENGEEFVTPECALCYSNNGLCGMTQRFHTLINNRLVRGKYRNKRRPVLLNCWEACYFDFDEEKLLKIGECAAKLGIEMLVIDDGWFGKRNSDNCSLGDWVIDRKKLPNGFDKIHSMLQSHGCGLGIWFEPEMISPDSDLYRLHPDWCLHIPGRQRSEGRNQLILDLSRNDVCEYIYECVASLLRRKTVDYIKWDFNRNVAEIGSVLLASEKQSEIMHRYYLGLYSVLERLVNDFPEVLFESCSGGGGRFDCGMLYYMPQTWTSDNTDAIERLKIQYGTSLIYPLSCMSGHVSASPNHQTGHVTPFKTRFNVAFNGSFGYELDPTKLDDVDKKLVTETAELYKKYGDVLVNGAYYRLRDNYHGESAAWCIVSENSDICIAVYVNTHIRLYDRNEHLRIKGIDKTAEYKEVKTGKIYSGAELSGFGVPIMCTSEFDSEMFIFEKIK